MNKNLKRMHTLMEYDLKTPNSFADNIDDDSMFEYQNDKEITLEDILKEEEPEEATVEPEKTEEPAADVSAPITPAPAEDTVGEVADDKQDEIEAMKAMMDGQLAEIKNSLSELSGVFNSIDELARQHQEISQKIQVLDKKVSDALPEDENSFQERMLNLSAKGSESPEQYFNNHPAHNNAYNDIKFDGKKYYKEVDFLRNDAFVKSTIENPDL